MIWLLTVLERPIFHCCFMKRALHGLSFYQNNIIGVQMRPCNCWTVLPLTVDHLSNTFLFSFTLTSPNSEVNSCGHVHGTYFDSSRTQLTDSGIYYFSSVIWVCSWLFCNCIEGWRPWFFSPFNLLSTTPALQRDLKACVRKWALGTGFTSGLETQLFLIYKCLVVRKSVSLP